MNDAGFVFGYAGGGWRNSLGEFQPLERKMWKFVRKFHPVLFGFVLLHLNFKYMLDKILYLRSTGIQIRFRYQ